MAEISAEDIQAAADAYEQAKALRPELDALLDGHWAERWRRFASVDCGPGWDDILIRAVTEILAADPTAEFAQIKEKFGGLRIYTEGATTAEVAAIVNQAEDASDNTCEVCGRPGAIRRDRSWHGVFCDAHARPVPPAQRKL